MSTLSIEQASLNRPHISDSSGTITAKKTTVQQPESAVNTSYFSSGTNPLELVYQAALDKLNEILLPDIGEGGLQALYDSGLDVSPEATAERIVSFSTGLLGSYLENYKEDDLGETFSRFTSVIRKGIEQGFAEARGILESLQVLEGSILEDVNQTYELVQEGLNNFEAEFRNTQGLV